MSATYKVLGQSAPTSTSNADVITVGAGKSQIISTITVTNITAAVATYRIAIRLAGAAIANSHWISYDVSLPAGDTDVITGSFTVSATDVVTVRSSVANAIAFGFYGVELA